MAVERRRTPLATAVCLTAIEVGGLLAYQAGIGVDAAGNMIYTDNARGLRVFYVSDGSNFAAGTLGYIAGQKMKAAIIVNIKGYTGWTSVTAPPTGFNYMLAGGGATAIGTSTPATLGSSLSFASDNKMYRMTVSPQGNIYIGDVLSPNRVFFFDINTGYLRTLFTSAASNVAKGSYCNGSTSGPISLSAYGDGCPVSKSVFTDGSTLSVGADPQGDLYMFDGTDSLVRKVLAQGFTPQTYNTTPASQTQTFQLHLPESAPGTVTGATATVTFSADIAQSVGTNPTAPSCSQNGDNTVDCTVSVTTVPTSVGQRSAALTVTLPTGSWTNPSATINLNQTETGSVMVVDSATLGGSPIAPATNAFISGFIPAAVAVDGAGNVYEASGTSIQESINGTTYLVATPTTLLPETPSQIAVDPTGNIFAVNSATSTITELQVTAAGAPATYSLTSVFYTPSSGSATPQAIATDQFGNLYVADYQASGSSFYRLSWSPPFIFYMNAIPGALMIVAVWFTMERQPMNLGLLTKGDWWGILTMAIGLAAFEIVLEDGNRKDWFGDPGIVKLAWTAAVFIPAFIVIELRQKEPLVDLRLFAEELWAGKHRQCDPGNWPLWRRIYPALVPGANARIRRVADRNGAYLARFSATPCHPPGPKVDAACRYTNHYRHRGCPVWRKFIPYCASRLQFCRVAVLLPPHHPCAGPASHHGSSFSCHHGRHGKRT